MLDGKGRLRLIAGLLGLVMLGAPSAWTRIGRTSPGATTPGSQA